MASRQVLCQIPRNAPTQIKSPPTPREQFIESLLSGHPSGTGMPWMSSADVEISLLIASGRRDRRGTAANASHLNDVLQLQSFDGAAKPKIFPFLHPLFSRDTIAPE